VLNPWTSTAGLAKSRIRKRGNPGQWAINECPLHLRKFQPACVQGDILLSCPDRGQANGGYLKVTAPLVCEAAELLLEGKFSGPGAQPARLRSLTRRKFCRPSAPTLSYSCSRRHKRSSLIEHYVRHGSEATPGIDFEISLSGLSVEEELASNVRLALSLFSSYVSLETNGCAKSTVAARSAAISIWWCRQSQRRLIRYCLAVGRSDQK
jgi:hypothetical protein